MDKGLQYLENIVKVNTELYNEIEKFVPQKEEDFGSLPHQLVIAGLGESVFKIREAVRAAKEIFGEELPVQENISVQVQKIKPSFYIKDNKVFTSQDITLEELIKVIKAGLLEKSKPANG